MQKQKTRIIVIAVSIVITLAILLAGYTSYNKYIIQKPLLNALEDTSFVNEVRLDKEGNIYQITIEMNKVDNLQTEFAKLDEITATHLGSQKYNLKISDARDQQLADFYSQLQPFIYEALAKDNYIWLNDEISRQIEDMYKNLDYKFFIDAEKIYLQFDNGRETLYEIIPRELSNQEVQV